MKPIQHPLEAAFNMGPGESEFSIEQEYGMTEVSPNLPVAQTEAPPDVKDADDILIENRIDEVYDAAIEAFQNQTAYMDVIEPRYAARNAEVAANYLNIALAAATSRSRVKTDRKRANQTFIPYANQGKTTNNIIVASREDVLRAITIDEQKKVLK